MESPTTNEARVRQQQQPRGVTTIASDRLVARDIVGGYGHGDVLHGISVAVPAGSTCALIGPNGAGKTSFLRALSAQLRTRSGTVLIDGEDVSRLVPYRVARLGLSHVPQGARLFPELTVEQNLAVAAAGCGLSKTDFADRVAEIAVLLPIVAERRNEKAGRLSGGQRQMVAIARGLVSRPKVLLLDEPTMGLAPQILDVLGDVITSVQAGGQTVLIAEQNAPFALALSHYVYLIKGGRVASEGESSDMRRRADVQEVYLGRSTHAGAPRPD
jgi:ABC-type branched-subunit amino acid transport system ATPase component